jgi:hypothetical protein
MTRGDYLFMMIAFEASSIIIKSLKLDSLFIVLCAKHLL